MIYILLAIIGAKINAGALYWVLYGLWIALSLFAYSVKHYLFYDHIKKDK